jgi:hypothetical protein
MALAGTFILALANAAAAQQQPMSFFVTSAGPGDGANLGGLAGADKHCQTLAAAAGAGAKTWRAYLSTQAAAGQPAVNARDRIGKGPWANAKGTIVARDVSDLHGDSAEQARRGNNISRTTALNEKGERHKGVGETPNQHDVLTGSQTDGTAFPAGQDRTCRNWTSNSGDSAQLGHFDRTGGGGTPPPTAFPGSWNSAHESKGCSQQNLVATGGNGYFYCFAID